MDDLSVQLALAFGGLHAGSDIPVKSEDEDEGDEGLSELNQGPDDDDDDAEQPPKRGSKVKVIRVLTRRESLLNFGNIGKS